MRHRWRLKVQTFRFWKNKLLSDASQWAEWVTKCLFRSVEMRLWKGYKFVSSKFVKPVTPLQRKRAQLWLKQTAECVAESSFQLGCPKLWPKSGRSSSLVWCWHNSSWGKRGKWSKQSQVFQTQHGLTKQSSSSSDDIRWTETEKKWTCINPQTIGKQYCGHRRQYHFHNSPSDLVVVPITSGSRSWSWDPHFFVGSTGNGSSALSAFKASWSIRVTCLKAVSETCKVIQVQSSTFFFARCLHVSLPSSRGCIRNGFGKTGENILPPISESELRPSPLLGVRKMARAASVVSLVPTHIKGPHHDTTVMKMIVSPDGKSKKRSSIKIWDGMGWKVGHHGRVGRLMKRCWCLGTTF